MNTDERTRVLASLLLDATATIEERDDAAMDLARSDAPIAFRALITVATDDRESGILQASAGESLALIWLRTGLFNAALLERLTPAAASEARALLARERPEWL